jgi:hypothetical protein
MKWIVSVTVVLVAACGGGGSTSSTSSNPLVTGDTCALHQDATSCRADTLACLWYANTRPCQVGQPCPVGWCSKVQPASGGGVSASAACACPGSGTDVCVEQIGGVAIQVQPPITCETISSSCAFSDRCACLTSSSAGTCRASDQVTNLCVCDNGIR